MSNLLNRIPWFVGAPGFVIAVLVAGSVANYLGADYFERIRLEEANPLAVAAPRETPAATPSTSADSPTPAPAVTQVAQPAGAVIVAKGAFRDGEPGHRGSGKATIGRDAAGNAVLVLEDFSVTNGPDLRVILGTGPDGGGDGLDLGKLKATDGTFTYAIPASADLASFKSVTIWCAAFPTIFAVATLEA